MSAGPETPRLAAAAPRRAAPLLRRYAAHVDILQIAIIIMTLTSVWRVQTLFTVLRPLEIPTIATLVACAAFAIDSDARRRLRTIRHPVTWMILATLAVVALSSPFGVYPRATLGFLLSDYSKTFVLFVLTAASVRNVRDLEILAGTQLVGASVYSVMMLLQFHVGDSGRLGELFYYDSNDLAMILAMALPLGVYFLRPGTRTIWRVVALCTFGVIVVTEVRTGSRGGFLALIAVVIFLVFRYTALSTALRIGAVTALMVGMMFVSNDQYWNMMDTILRPTEDYNYAGNSEGGRIEIWKRGLGYAEERPLFGVGAANFGFAEENLGRAAERRQAGLWTRRLAAHNSFVLALAELGFTGFFVFSAMLWYAFKSLRTSALRALSAPAADRNELALAQSLRGGMIAFVVAGFFLSQTYSVLLYVFMGMIVGLSKIQAVRSPRVPPLAPGRARTPGRRRWG